MDDHPAPSPEPALGRGRRMALDVGTVRIGVALSDPDGLIATPHTTVRREEGVDVRRVAEIVEHEHVAVAYVGLPRTLRGRDSASTELARRIAAQLARTVPVPVRLVDERLSTVGASRLMHEAGRSSRRQRADIDAAAAVVILQTALDTERARCSRAGVQVDEAEWTPASGRQPRKPRHRKTGPTGRLPNQEGTS